MTVPARRCLGCQKFFYTVRKDARCCRSACRVAAARLGRESGIRATLKRADDWFDQVQTFAVREPSVTDMWHYHEGKPKAAAIELPPDVMRRVQAGEVELRVIIVDPKKRVTDRVTDHRPKPKPKNTKKRKKGVAKR